jgi:hypothetical protein
MAFFGGFGLFSGGGVYSFVSYPFVFGRKKEGILGLWQTAIASRRVGAGFGCGVRRRGCMEGSGYLRLV